MSVTQTSRRPRTALLSLLLAELVALLNMRAVSDLTLDDAFISFRYGRNLARGLGLVYNVGERVEGYTNFSWTLLSAVAASVGWAPETVAKLVGGTALLVAIVVVDAIAARLAPSSILPPIAPWLMASSITQTGHAVWGMETSLFVLLVLAGFLRLMIEVDQTEGQGFPWSGVLFALAALTRPEAPLFFAIAVLSLERRLGSSRSWRRILGFAIPVGAHLLWRYSYYGAWVPHTAIARAPYLSYLRGEALDQWWQHIVPNLAIYVAAAAGAALLLTDSRREPRAHLLALLAAIAAFLWLGSDWMPGWRYLALAEALLFLIAGYLIQRSSNALARRWQPVLVAVLLLAGLERGVHLRAQQRQAILRDRAVHERFFRNAGEWLASQPRGLVATSDIGLVGYLSDFPLLDYFGLVSPEITALRRQGPDAAKAVRALVLARKPRYLIGAAAKERCEQGLFGVFSLGEEAALPPNYQVGTTIGTQRSLQWCVLVREDP